MSLRVVLLFLLVMAVIAFLGGPKARRIMKKLFGIGRRDR
ncbi:hypothetical protein PANO111632_15010 [Paracoccus nototheniae]